MSSQKNRANRPRVLIKLGTSVLTAGTRQLHRPTMVDLVRQFAELHAAGTELIICSSGAIIAGRERLNFPKPKSVTEKQMLAAVGQSALMFVWEQLFDIYGIQVGQMLLTSADFENRGRFLNARDTLNALLAHDIVPIINENDAVTTEEIQVGDNDNLSARAAVMAEAPLLVLLTDQKGLFTADPRHDHAAHLISEVREIDESMWQAAGGSGTQVGTGGMVTKLQAADIARRGGTEVIIAAGLEPNVVHRLIIDREPLGTRFLAVENPLKNRKRWILAGSKAAGSVTINEKAVRVLTGQKGRSLLPAGIIHIEGQFARGETIAIRDKADRELGRGIVRYASDDLHQIMGHHSDKIEAILGFGFGPVAIHRNDMVLLVENAPAGKKVLGLEQED